MDPVSGSKEQMVAAAAAAAALAASGQRAQKLTAADLARLRDRVRKSVVLRSWSTDGSKTSPATIIASSPAFCYVMLHKATVGSCEIVFPTDGARFKLKRNDFMTINSHLAVAKINKGLMVPVRFTEIPVSFMDSVYLYVKEGRGLTPGFVVNPTGESKQSNIPGHFQIDNAPELASLLGGPVFDEAGEFLGIVISHDTTCIAIGASNIKEMLRQNLPAVALGELTSLKVL